MALPVIGSSRAAPRSNKFVDIDYALRREELGDRSTPITTETKEVSRDWLDSLRRAERARRAADFESRPYVNEVTLTPPKHGGSGPRLNVGVLENPDSDRYPDGLSTAEARDRVPEKVGEIPVDVFETGAFELGCYENDYGEFVPPGAQMESGYDNSYCTLGAALNEDGDRYFSTCQHLFDGDNPTSRNLYNQDEDAAIGDIVESHCQDDFVVAEPINGHSPAGRLAEDGGTMSDLTVVKQFTKDALQDKIANDENLSKRGVRTCKTSGEIGSANGYIGVVDTGCSDRPHQVKWGSDDDFDDGDSGSVAYQQIGHDQIGIAGVCNGRDPNPLASAKVFGTAAWHIEADHGYTYV